MSHKRFGIRDTEKAETRSQSVRTSLSNQSHLNWFMLVIAGVITAFGLLIVVPPFLNSGLSSHWAWATQHMVLIVLLSLAMLALVGLWHQRRYITLLRDRFEQLSEEVKASAKQNTARLYALLDVSHVMGASASLESVLDRITEMCADVFRCDHTSLMLFVKEMDELVVRSIAGPRANPEMIGATQKIGEGISGWAARRLEPLLLGQDFDPRHYPGLEANPSSVSAAMVVPVVLSGELVGIINVSTRSLDVDYNDEDFRALQVFAENVGACIRHAEQSEWMKQTIRELQLALKAKRHPSRGEGIVHVLDTKNNQ